MLGRLALIGLSSTAVLTLAACGGSSSSSSSSGSPSATTSTGSGSASSSSSVASSAHVVTTPKFMITVPAGWTNNTTNQADIQKIGLTGPVLLLLETQAPGAFIKNVNDVTPNLNVTTATQPVAADQLAQYLQSVQRSGQATNLSAPQPTTIGGEPGVCINYDQQVSGTLGRTLDCVVNHSGATYDFVFNTSQYSYDQMIGDVTQMIASISFVG